MKNLKLVKKKEADRWFLRNKKSFNDLNHETKKIISLIKNINHKAEKILEIGCSNGHKLNQYSKLLKSKLSYGIDLSKKAIDDGKKNIRI